MGGGDLNLKKSWHPSTLKNQEKVWKAEKQKAHEDKKIAELQRELREERDRESLIQAGENAGTIKAESKELNWMYKGPNSHVSREEYLLGRKIDKTFEMLEKEEQVSKGKPEEAVINKPAYTIEHEINPEAVIQKEDSNIQVDMKRKLLEDPLLMIRQKEESTKRSITSNPVKMKQLEMLINSLKEKRKKKKHKKLDGHKHKNSGHKEKKSKKSRKHKKKEKSKKKKKKHSKKDSSSEDDSDSSSHSDSESVEAIRRRQVKEMIDRETRRAFLLRNASELSQGETKEDKKGELKNNKDEGIHNKSVANRENKEREHKSSSRNEREEKSRDPSKSSKNSHGRDRESREKNSKLRKNKMKSRSRSSSRSRERNRSNAKETKNDSLNNIRKRDEKHETSKKYETASSSKKHRSRSNSKSREKHSDRKESEDREEVMRRKREEMISAAASRDSDRRRNVEKYKEEKEKEEKESQHSQECIRDLGGSSVASSVESRIRSKVGFSQRKADHMNSNFLRK